MNHVIGAGAAFCGAGVCAHRVIALNVSRTIFIVNFLFARAYYVFLRGAALFEPTT
jgi:hypothetical protein